MFWTIGKFEAWYQLRSPFVWIWALLSFSVTASLFIFEEMRLGNGTSLVATSANGFFPIFAGIALALMVPMTSLLGPAVVRDLHLGSGELLKATLMTRTGYVFGRFCGAFFVIALIYALHIPVIWLVCQLPHLPVEKYPDFEILALLQPAAVMAMTLIATAGLLFAIGTITRSALVSYVVVALMIAAWAFSLTKLQFGGFEEMRNAIDWTGISSVFISNDTRAIHERNTDLLTLNHDFYINRAVWLGVGAMGLVIAWLVQGLRGGLWGNRRQDAASGIMAPEVGPLQQYVTVLDRSARRTQLSARLVLDLKRVLLSPAYLILLLGSMGLAWIVAQNAGAVDNRNLEPVTRLMIKALIVPTQVIILIVAGIFSSELVWGDTDRKINELVDTAPTSNLSYVAPKVFAIVLAALVFVLTSALIGMVVQWIKGYPLFEVGKLLLWFVWPMTLFAFFLVVLALACHSITPNKFVGWGFYIAITLGLDIASNEFGFNHVLNDYAFGADVPLSDFNGQAQFAMNSAWLEAYWTLISGCLIIVAVAMWRRGTEQRLKPRLAALPATLKSPLGGALAAFAGATLVLGGWILYHNPFETDGAKLQAQVDEETELAPLEGLPGPTVVALKIDVDIRPKKLIATAKGVMTIENRTAAPLSRMVFNTAYTTLKSASMVGATRGNEIEDYGVEFWTFKDPMQPGEKRELNFETYIDANSIGDSEPETSVVSNGTFIDSAQLVPTLRINRSNWLDDQEAREKHGLPKKRPIPAAMLDENFYTPGSGWIDAAITISTDAGQTPIAPGVLIGETKKDGRVTRVYKPPAKINNMFSLQSATYVVKRGTILLKNGPVALEIYHLPGFTRNLDKMMGAMKYSLTSLSGHYGDYPFKVLRIVQTPGYGKDGYAAQALAGTIPFFEDGGWLETGLRSNFDELSQVVAHEVAHMWWGHQIAPSNRPGALVLVESLAELSSWVVGQDQVNPASQNPNDDFSPTWSAQHEYSEGRGKEKIGEPTLALMEREEYLAYQKGPLALDIVRNQMGHETFDAVLRDFVPRYRFVDKPYPTIQDLLGALRAKAAPSLQPLITQLFEDRVRWDSKISKFAAIPSAKSGWTINLDAAAWTEHLDPLGKVVRKIGVPEALLKTQSQSACDADTRNNIGVLVVPGQRVNRENTCWSFSDLSEYRLNFQPSQSSFTLKSSAPEKPANARLGAAIMDAKSNAEQLGNATQAYFPFNDFLPPKPKQE